MFIKKLIWKIKEPYAKRKRAYYEGLWCEGKMSAEEMCERVAELYRTEPAKKGGIDMTHPRLTLEKS